ncbi:MAG: hypothetical protein AAGK97_08780 [Bacteroidota bacterium]
MKKVLFAFLLFLFTIQVQAQLKFGITAGLHFTSESWSGDGSPIEFENLQSFQIGLALKTELSDVIHIKGNALYNIAGARILDGSGQDLDAFKQNVQLEARLAARIFSGFYLEFGPFISYLIDVDEGVNIDAFEKLGVGVIPAATLSLGETLELSGYYQLGLSNLSATEFTDAVGNVLDGSVNAYQYGLRLTFYLN